MVVVTRRRSEAWIRDRDLLNIALILPCSVLTGAPLICNSSETYCTRAGT